MIGSHLGGMVKLNVHSLIERADVCKTPFQAVQRAVESDGERCRVSQPRDTPVVPINFCVKQIYSYHRSPGDLCCHSNKYIHSVNILTVERLYFVWVKAIKATW